MAKGTETLSIEQAARVIGISRGLMYELAREGRVPVLRLGRRLLVPRAALDNYLANPPQPVARAKPKPKPKRRATSRR